MKIVLIGAGNVATHLGNKLVEVGEEVVQVFSRNRLKALQLANEIGVGFTNDLKEITPDGDLYILAVHDDAIGQVAHQLSENGLNEKLIVHTSGGTPMQFFKDAAPALKRVGVFYPLQSFSKIRRPDFQKIPICVDARQDDDMVILIKLAHKLSKHVFHITDEQRGTLHLAAVFVNNFTNHLFAVGERIQTEAGLPFEMLLPLIHETVAKLTDGPPATMQTGPAVRHDEATIQRHLFLLENQPELQKIYRILTKNIQEYQ